MSKGLYPETLMCNDYDKILSRQFIKKISPVCDVHHEK